MLGPHDQPDRLVALMDERFKSWIGCKTLALQEMRRGSLFTTAVPHRGGRWRAGV